ncbi:1-acyl-sn-glycerol-3-phosphate acyltransferase [candidate division KSB1 bacterium]|nr:1-acyl-sn-glycerol-3-phosphate acyltransferase [candidate division KSB1 bacterium]
MEFFYRLSQFVVRSLLRMFYDFRVSGLENLPRKGRVILAANHPSLADPPVIGAAAHRELYYLAKEELFRIPILRGVIRKLNTVPINRSIADIGAIRTAYRMLEKGRALILFPEGGRSPDGRLQGFKAGVGMIALRSGADIVPVRVIGTHKLRWSPFSRQRIWVRFGPKISVYESKNENMNKKDLYQKISQTVWEKIEGMGHEGGG